MRGASPPQYARARPRLPFALFFFSARAIPFPERPSGGGSSFPERWRQRRRLLLSRAAEHHAGLATFPERWRQRRRLLLSRAAEHHAGLASSLTRSSSTVPPPSIATTAPPPSIAAATQPPPDPQLRGGHRAPTLQPPSFYTVGVEIFKRSSTSPCLRRRLSPESVAELLNCSSPCPYVTTVEFYNPQRTATGDRGSLVSSSELDAYSDRSSLNLLLRLCCQQPHRMDLAFWLSILR
nr:uncharacterized protein LOC117837869 [Setaria viridis]